MTDGVDVRRGAGLGDAVRLTVRVGGRVVMACDVAPDLDPEDLAETLRYYVSVRAAGRQAASAPLAPPLRLLG